MRQSSPLVYSPENEFRHGVHYIPRHKEPSMFQILSWKEGYDAASDKKWLINLKEGNQQGRFTEPRKYEKGQNIPQVSKQKRKDLQVDHHIHPHEIKHELYYYGQQKTKGPMKPVVKSPEKPKEKAKKQIKKLNQFNEQDKREIQIRKKNIQKFDAFTRQLPNSAFTTYFGKPAFAHYGLGAAGNSPKMADLKSHSVMPHAGKNEPEFVQTHQGALNKANVINLESYVPRVPVGDHPINDCKVAIKEYYNVQIVKPDLVNEVRFANQSNDIKYRSKTPKHDELNFIPKRIYAKSPQIQPVKNIKPKKKARFSQEKLNDRLVFMNKRQNFMKELKQKQKVQFRLAYKVTQCYPYDWQNETAAASTAREDRWKQIRPAGVSSYRSLHEANYRSF